MSKAEKLLLLEEIWQDLSRAEAEVDAPEWHEEVLRETENRVSLGTEIPVDWGKAKATSASGMS